MTRRRSTSSWPQFLACSSPCEGGAADGGGIVLTTSFLNAVARRPVDPLGDQGRGARPAPYAEWPRAASASTYRPGAISAVPWRWASARMSEGKAEARRRRCPLSAGGCPAACCGPRQHYVPETDCRGRSDPGRSSTGSRLAPEPLPDAGDVWEERRPAVRWSDPS